MELEDSIVTTNGEEILIWGDHAGNVALELLDVRVEVDGAVFEFPGLVRGLDRDNVRYLIQILIGLYNDMEEVKCLDSEC